MIRDYTLANVFMIEDNCLANNDTIEALFHMNSTGVGINTTSGPSHMLTVVGAISGSGKLFNEDGIETAGNLGVSGSTTIVGGVVAGTNQHLKKITGITQANPAVVTSVAHGLADDQKISLCGVDGMHAVNSNQGNTYAHYTVDNKTDNTFELSGINSSGYDAYTGGGIISTPISTGDNNCCGSDCNSDYCSITQNARSGIFSITIGDDLANTESTSITVYSTEIVDGDVILTTLAGGDAAGQSLTVNPVGVVSEDSFYEGAGFGISISNYTGGAVNSNPTITIHWKAL